jgi:hypothetical protein
MNKYLRWTKPGGETALLTLSDPSYITSEYAVIEATGSQNRLRHMLSVLHRTRIAGQSAYGDLWDLKVTFIQGEYRLWTYVRNWPGKASYLAGILVGQSRLWKKRRRRRKQRRV